LNILYSTAYDNTAIGVYMLTKDVVNIFFIFLNVNSLISSFFITYPSSSQLTKSFSIVGKYDIEVTERIINIASSIFKLFIFNS